MNVSEEERDEALLQGIAIVGMAARLPGAANVDEFWQNLVNGVESVSFFSDAELEDDFGPEVRNAPNFVRARPVLQGVEAFDAEFFGMYAREAELTDPQQRLFLECAWEALEDAGYDPGHMPVPVGVFGGNSMNTYFLRHLCGQRGTIEEFTSSYQVGCYPMLVGSAADFLATRVSYKLDLKGPGVDLSSACSTSLLAVAMACQSLRLYQCDMALAGGVSITFPQKRGYLHQEGGMVSADGHCRTFDADASGTIFGSGAGMVALKRYEEALADGDHIYAVIRGCGVNNDGADKVGFTAPSVDGQAACIRAALDEAEVDARSIGYVECHGTATPLGDPIEVAGLTKAFRQDTEDSAYCAIGSAKTNVGHLDAAAGVTGLIKAALSLKHARLPASLHYRRPNPRIPFESTPFFVNDRLRDWQRGMAPRRAGVSAFGVGGTNVHVVLEEAPETAGTPESGRRPRLLLLAARTGSALERMAANLATHLRAHPEISMEDVAYTLARGRARFEARGFVVAEERTQAIAALEQWRRQAARASDPAPGVVFVFPGQGSQYPDMGRGLYGLEAEFRRHVDHCAEILRPLIDEDLRALLYPPAEDAAGAAERLMATVIAQPAIFTVEYALARLWQSWGIQPAAMIGHSVGEWVAAVLAGVVSLEDALALVAERGRLMEALPRGGMLSVRLPEAEVLPLLDESLAIAAINSPSLCVVSGPFEDIESLAARLAACGVMSRPLHTSHAFHSPMMQPVLGPLRAAAGRVRLQAPRLPIISCVSGRVLTPEEATSPDYWAHHAREPVRFADGIACLIEQLPSSVLLEVGPGNVLTTLARQCLPGAGVTMVASLPGSDRELDDGVALLAALGRLWAAGVEPDWSALSLARGRRVPLPTYPFERRRHWVEAPRRQGVPALTATACALAEPASVAETVAEPLPAAGGSGDGEMLARLKSVLEDLSGEVLGALGEDATFLELGFDSLFLTQVAQKLQSLFHVKLTFRQLLGEYGRLGDLAALLEDQGQVAATATTKAQSEAATATEDAAAAPSRFDAYLRKNAHRNSELPPAIVAHIAALSERSEARMGASKASTRAWRPVLADPRAASGFRSDWKELVYPLVVTRCQGAHLWDKDGNRYIDLVNGYGQTFFGHAPDFIVAALREQLDKGFAIGPQAEYAGEVAALFAEMTGNERVTFCNTGSEAVMAAMRIARAVTGRDKVVVFNGDYHGQFDEVLVKGVGQAERRRSQPIAGGIPASAVSNMVVLEYGAPESLAWILDNAGEIAAVVVEPVQSRHPALRPFGFLRELRHITEAAGSALVLDEVVTGFRVHPGGIQAVTGIRADLATYGKVVGGGMPIGILAGKARFMDALDGGQWDYGDDSFPEVGVTFFAGTFVRHPLALAAARAVLLHMRSAGPALQEGLARRTEDLVARLNALFVRYGLQADVEHYSSFFYFHPHQDQPMAALLYYHLREQGIHIQNGFPCFLTTAHSDADLDRVVAAFEAALQALHGAGVLAAPTRTAAAALPLTESQMEIWLAAQMGDAASCVFNESVTLHLAGDLDSPALRRALEALVLRHEVLRLRFEATGEGMRVLPEPDFGFCEIGLPDDPARAREEYLRQLRAEAETPFDLVAGPVFRVRLLHGPDNAHELILSAHHIVCDGWSINVLVAELAQLYAAERRGGMAPLPAALPFSRYARDLRRSLEREGAALEAYWRRQFEAMPEPLELPTDRPRAPEPSYRGASLTTCIDFEFYQALKKAGARQGSTLFATLLAAFQVLVGRLAGQNDVAVGVPTAGQAQLEGAILVGHCVHFLPIRGRWDARTTFGEHLRAVSRQVLDAYEHQGTTLGTLVRTLDPPRRPGLMPLTQVQFNLERLDTEQSWPELRVAAEPNPKAFVNFDLFLNIIESKQGLRLDCDYNTDLFDAETVSHWLEIYRQLLECVVERPDEPVVRADWLPPDDKRQWAELNRTEREYPREICFDAWLRQQWAGRMDRVAAVCGERGMTYAELDQASDRLAGYLAGCLPAAGEVPRVGVCVRRSLDTLVALLAVLKAGAAYVPLDPCHPAERLQYILEDAGVAALISNLPEARGWFDGHARLIDPDRDAVAIAAAGAAAPRQRSADDPAYLIYTSGSTGRPKGVEIGHRALVNFLHSMARQPGLAEEDRFLAVTTVAFDISGLELYLPLLTGARLIIADDEEGSDGFRLLSLIRNQGVTAMQATPAGWQLLLEADFVPGPGFKALVGGEALPRQLADRLLQGGAELWNMYGPTETTIWSSCRRVQADGAAIGVGGPIDNTRFHILDGHDQPVPIGVPGQLHIGGDGVAHGYHLRPELTAERFIRDPFAAGRLYRTGDLARLLPGGEVRVLGRMDFQVKLRGYRIELGEIEARLLAVAPLAAAAASVREDVPGVRRLVAYLVPLPGSTLDTAAIAEALARSLPDYMIPTAWVSLDDLPRLANGKLDRAALPAPAGAAAGGTRYVAPASPREEAMARIWGEVLGLERVGRLDDLFSLGVDSILMFKIVARSVKDGLPVTAKLLMECRTPAALAERLDAAEVEPKRPGRGRIRKLYPTEPQE